ncbi:MAG: hypothetical protein OXI07_02250, partial [Gammaproteobacteria bacterium]|nr:hypothetical protein [Gammaproteobacteria bacterium]
MRSGLLLASCAATVCIAGCGPSADAPREADEAAEVTEITAAGTAFPNTIGETHWFTFQRKVE